MLGALKKIFRNQLFEILASLLLVTLATPFFVVRMTLLSTPTWYGIAAASTVFVLFVICAVFCIFAVGRELRASVAKWYTRKKKEPAENDITPETDPAPENEAPGGVRNADFYDAQPEMASEVQYDELSEDQPEMTADIQSESIAEVQLELSDDAQNEIPAQLFDDVQSELPENVQSAIPAEISARIPAEAGSGEVISRRTVLRDIIVIAACCLAFAVLIMAATVVISWIVGENGNPVSLLQWRFINLDSQHYLYIAEHGYTPKTSDEYGRVVEIVFFPGYPLLIKLFAFVVRDYFVAGMTVSILSFIAAAILLYIVVLDGYGRKDALYAVFILMLMPGSFFFVTPMSESLFLALTLATILMIKKKKWLAAGLFGMYCALTRSAGIFLVIIFCFELFKDFLSEIGIRSQTPKAKTVGKYILRLLPVLLIAGGLGAYLVLNYVLNGDPFSFVYYERVQWGQTLGLFFETAASSANHAVQYMMNADSHSNVGISVFVMNIVAMCSILGVTAVKRRRLTASYIMYGLAYFTVSYGVTWLLSGVRYMDGLFLMPLAFAAGSGKYIVNEAPKDDLKECRRFNRGRIRNAALIIAMTAVSVLYMVMFCKRLQIW